MSSTQTVTHGKLQPSRTHDYLYGEKFSDFFRKSVTLAKLYINDRKKLFKVYVSCKSIDYSMDNTFYKYPNQFAAFYGNINVYS